MRDEIQDIRDFIGMLKDRVDKKDALKLKFKRMKQ